MAAKPVPQEVLLESESVVAECGGNVSEASKRLGVARGTLQHRLRILEQQREGSDAVHDKKPRTTQTLGAESGIIEDISYTRKTPDQVFAASGLDPAVWRIDRSVVNHWGADREEGDQACYQCKLWIGRRVPLKVESAVDLLTDRLARYVGPKVAKRRIRKDADHLVEICLPDHHFGKLAWRRETGEDYDLGIAERLFVNAVAEILRRTEHLPTGQFVFPLGNDLLHIDNPKAETYAGTPQDTDGRFAKVFAGAFMACVQAIDLAAARAPVHVVWVPGNHDTTASYHLCFALRERYRDDARVDVDVTPSPRKYVRWDRVLIGYTHGNEERHQSLPTIMATERPQDWADTVEREWHLGHFHARKTTAYTPVATHDGVTVRVLPSLCGRDSWHHAKGYIGGRRSCEAYLWTKAGYAGHIAVNAEEIAA